MISRIRDDKGQYPDKDVEILEPKLSWIAGDWYVVGYARDHGPDKVDWPFHVKVCKTRNIIGSIDQW